MGARSQHPLCSSQPRCGPVGDHRTGWYDEREHGDAQLQRVDQHGRVVDAPKGVDENPKEHELPQHLVGQTMVSGMSGGERSIRWEASQMLHQSELMPDRCRVHASWMPVILGWHTERLPAVDNRLAEAWATAAESAAT